MSTIDSRSFIDRIIAGNGWLPEYPDHDAPDNPPVVRIIEYTNFNGKTAWGVVFQDERDLYRYERPTEFVQNPRVIWTREAVAS